MNNYIKNLLITLISLASFACQSDLLDTIPNDRISNEIFWQTIADAEFAANSVYPSLDGLGIFAYDGIADLTLTNHPFAENVDTQRGFGTVATSRFFSEWQSSFQGIRRANDFLDNIDRVTHTDAAAINRLKGEVMTIRAYHYIKLAMLFGDVPLITRGINIQEGRTITRMPVAQIWDFVEADLTQAASWLPYQSNTRIGKGAALGLKARGMLFAGRFASAAAAAKELMDSGQFSLYPNYFQLFQYEGQNNPEVLLDRQQARDVNAQNIYAVLAPWSQIPGSTGSLYVPTAAMIDLYDMDNGKAISDPESGFDPTNPYENRDPRLYHSVFLTERTPLPGGGVFGSTPNRNGSDAVQITIYSTSTGYNIRKYVDAQDYNNPSNSGLNIILIRYAEILLTYAEAKVELGEIDQTVFDAINEVRQRPSVEMPPISQADAANQDQLRQIIRKERTVELAFEGLRLFDIRRWRIAEQVMPGTPMGMTYVEGSEIKQVELPGFERSFDPNRDYLWPIPQRERELNPNLTQNPNW
jgi:starch-binding outer membrane protein, SusD/RagB family